MRWSVSEAKARLDELLTKARRAPQVIESRGEPVAVVISKAEFDRLRALEAETQPTPLARLLEFTDSLKLRADLTLDLPARTVDDMRATVFADEE